ncbi:glycosyltransferase [Vibrio cholerae]|nr:glycosyltransferase [Vibrio cholerae]BCN20472.1 putative glycosyltransferase [Vibrio cholerae]GIA97010.1 glycosyl transferase [Vibrio cholerae]
MIITSNLYKPNVGGVENSLYYLAKSSPEVIIVSSDIGYCEKYKDEEDINVIRYEVSKSKYRLLRFLSHIKSAYLCYRELYLEGHRNVIARYHLNIIILYLCGYRNIAYIVPGVVKNQNVTSNLNDLSSGFLTKARYYIDCILQRIALRLSKIVYVFSENMIGQVKNIEKKIKPHLVYPGVDPSVFAMRENAGREKTIFISICRLVGAKGLQYSIEAFRYLPDEYEYHIYGDGPDYDSLNDLIKKIGLSGKVILKGKTLKPHNAYMCSDYFLLPSIYEPFGQTILEASSCGLPTIAFSSNIANTSTYNILESYGFYCESLDAKDFAETIVKAIHETNDFSRDEIRKRIISNYSWTSLLERVKNDLYNLS